MNTKNIHSRGYTLVELIVAVGLFSVVMTIASGSYLLMINLNRQAQAMTVGISDLSFALETMSRSIRTGTEYSCGGSLVLGDCVGGGNSFSYKNTSGITVSYSLVSPSIIQTVSGAQTSLTDPATVTVSSLRFYVSGTKTPVQADYLQPNVTVVVSGTVSTGAGKTPQSFTIQTGATTRKSDI